jgi:hypothetical protein
MKIPAVRIPETLRWNRTSYFLFSGFLATVGLIIAVWWPLAEEYLGMIDPRYPVWRQLDWLLIGIFAAMSILIMGGANLRADALIILVGLAGGLTIEAWGTQTLLWTYYTNERPPLWIVPAWPIASLAIDRIYRMVQPAFRRVGPRAWNVLYAVTLGGFLVLMAAYVWPTFGKPFTVAAAALCVLLYLSPGDRKTALLMFLAGSGLGYFLELWGTTRGCWTYYTRETPPLFAVFAHGMAALAFWRTMDLLRTMVFPRLRVYLSRYRPIRGVEEDLPPA